jgi:hypothetical protein
MTSSSLKSEYLATRATPPPKLDEKQTAEFLEKAKAIASKYHTELLERA